MSVRVCLGAYVHWRWIRTAIRFVRSVRLQVILASYCHSNWEFTKTRTQKSTPDLFMFIFPFLFHFFVIISSDNLTNTGVCITTQLIRIQTVSYEEYKLILVFFSVHSSIVKRSASQRNVNWSRDCLRNWDYIRLRLLFGRMLHFKYRNHLSNNKIPSITHSEGQFGIKMSLYFYR